MLFRINKAKIVLSVCFLIYPCNKKYPENISSLNTPKLKYDFFLEYLRISGTENTAGGASTWPRGSRARPPASWAHGGSPPLIPAPTQSFFLPKNHHPAQARVLAHFAAIFDLLAQSNSHKTTLGDCSLVCDSSNGPISFCSSALFIANLCCLGDHVLELAC